ncbi:acyltransferase family protein [Microbacterium sp. NPDC055455]
MSRRDAALDALRVLGITAVVAGHVWDNQAIRELIYTWHVPLFFVLSGYLWKRGRSVRAEAASRWRTIGLPYVAWLVIIAIPFLIVNAQGGTDVLAQTVRIIAGGAYIGRPFSAFWFMTALLIACVVFRWLERFPPIMAWSTALFGLGLATFVPNLVAKVPLSGGVAVAAITFLLIGQAMRDLRHRIGRPVVVGFALLCLSAALIIAQVARPLDLKRSDFGTPILSPFVAAAICIGLILLSEAIFAKAEGWLPRTLTSLATVGTVVVLSHAVVLWILDTPKNGSWLDFLPALTIPWVAAWLLARTMASPVLVGAPRFVAINPMGRSV